MSSLPPDDMKAEAVGCQHLETETRMIDAHNGWISCASCKQPLSKLVPKWVGDALDNAIKSQ